MYNIAEAFSLSFELNEFKEARHMASSHASFDPCQKILSNNINMQCRKLYHDACRSIYGLTNTYAKATLEWMWIGNAKSEVDTKVIQK